METSENNSSEDGTDSSRTRHRILASPPKSSPTETVSEVSAPEPTDTHMGNFRPVIVPAVRQRRWGLNFYCLQVVFCALLIWVVIMNIGLYFLYSATDPSTVIKRKKEQENKQRDGLSFSTVEVRKNYTGNFKGHKNICWIKRFNVKDLDAVVEDFLAGCQTAGLSNLLLIQPDLYIDEIESFRWSTFAQSKSRILTFLFVGRFLPECKPNLDKVAEYLQAQMFCKEDGTHVLISTPAVTFHLVATGNKYREFYVIKPLNDSFSADTLRSIGLTEASPVMFLNQAAALEAKHFDKVEESNFDGIKLTTPSHRKRFIRELQNSNFLRCNEERRREFYANFPEMLAVANSKDAKEFRRVNRHILKQVSQALAQMEIPFWICSGTCLGWFRQCDVISYSGDVDIGIMAGDYSTEIVPALESRGLQLRMKLGTVEDSLQYSFIFKEIKLDIYFFYEEGATVWNGATKPETGEKFRYTFAKFGLCWTEFLEVFVRVPCPTRQFLEANYGQGWFQPLKQWDWMRSPPNARSAGKWNETVIKEAVQVFEVK